MFNLRYKKKLCVPSYDALKDMARHDVPPSFVETIILDGEDYCTNAENAQSFRAEMNRYEQSSIHRCIP
ncbi:MAG: hypothetical protein Q7J68_02325 [Thermoplasmata archaeon]|nr:hypothetical protein [Thermoplasmata archaeon]